MRLVSVKHPVRRSLGDTVARRSATYHAIVERICRRNVARVNAHDDEPLLAACRLDVHHRFGGDHALGGQRHDVHALRARFDRLERMCPTLHLAVTDVWTKGLPHDTTALLRWDATQDLPDGTTYTHHGVHVVRLLWLKVVSIDANEDSQAVERAMALFAAHGVIEATAAPITS